MDTDFVNLGEQLAWPEAQLYFNTQFQQQVHKKQYSVACFMDL